MKRLSLLRPSRPFPVASGTREGEPYEHMNPRLGAIRLLREHIADRRAGLDPYDRSTFLVDASPVEGASVQRALERTGAVLYSSPHGAGIRYRAIVEADVRQELGLDADGAPTLDDEPLASRGVTETIHRHIDALAAPEAQVRVLTLADGLLENETPFALPAFEEVEKPLSTPVRHAIETAKAAYDRRYPAGGVFDQERQ